VLCPVPPSIQSIASYTYCGKTVCLCKKQSIILLREPGYYALSFGGPNFVSGNVTVSMKQVTASSVADSLLNNQCGVCHEFDATVELRDCDGITIGFAYGVNDYAPENATIQLAACSATPFARILSKPQDGHMTALAFCSKNGIPGATIGYMAEDDFLCIDGSGGCQTGQAYAPLNINYTVIA
jgi:hypothetical protein